MCVLRWFNRIIPLYLACFAGTLSLLNKKIVDINVACLFSNPPSWFLFSLNYGSQFSCMGRYMPDQANNLSILFLRWFIREFHNVKHIEIYQAVYTT